MTGMLSEFSEMVSIMKLNSLVVTFHVIFLNLTLLIVRFVYFSFKL